MQGVNMKAILVVDDDYTIRSGIKTIMACLFPAINVLEAANGQEGVIIAQNEQPDMILLDENMPVMSGYETAKTLRQLPLTCQIPLIGISGNNPNDLTTQNLRQLCDAWLPKPFSPDDLLLLVISCEAV
jgi:CheY-like chemotaxis protein